MTSPVKATKSAVINRSRSSSWYGRMATATISAFRSTLQQSSATASAADQTQSGSVAPATASTKANSRPGSRPDSPATPGVALARASSPGARSPNALLLAVDHASATTATAIAEAVEAERVARQLHRCKSHENAPVGTLVMSLFAVVGSPAGSDGGRMLLVRGNSSDQSLAADMAVRAAIEFFAFPRRPRSESLPDAGAAVAQLELADEQAPFVFVLTTTDAHGDRRVMYGSCLQSLGCEQIAPLSGSFVASADGRVTLSDRCFVIVSATPLLSVHFHALLHVAKRERLRLTDVLRAGDGGGNGIANAANDEPWLAHRFFERFDALRLPEVGDTLVVSEQLSVTREPGDDEWNSLGAFGAVDALVQLGPRLLCTVLSALLQEVKVVIACADLALLSKLVLSLSCLLRPFFWQGALVTVLPEHFKPLLGAPTVIFAGILELDESTRDELSDAVLIVDVVSGREGDVALRWGDEKPFEMSDFAPLPRHGELEVRLGELLDQVKRERVVAGGTARLATAICGAVRAHIDAALLGKFVQSCVRENVSAHRATAVSVFVPAMFLAWHDASEVDFFEALFATQIWSVFCDARLRARDTETNDTSPRPHKATHIPLTILVDEPAAEEE
jgi:hypothetical protein